MARRARRQVKGFKSRAGKSFEVVLKLFGLVYSRPEREPPPGISPGTVATLERMKRKVAKQSAASLSVDESRRVDAEIDDALARSGGELLLEEFRARLKNPQSKAEGRPEQPDLIERGPATAEASKGQGR